MYTEIETNEHYELGIVGDLVCLKFKPAFDQVLGEDRGKRSLGKFGGVEVLSDSNPGFISNDIYVPGKMRQNDTITVVCRPDNPQKYAEQLHGALQEYIASKQPFKKGGGYWSFWLAEGVFVYREYAWGDYCEDHNRRDLGIAFKTKEECEKCIEETKEFWRSR
ncbi:MAG: hypothetical protein E6Q97_29825 [Desulfurellales bacterium]|nr:MAG: hypothetical protein E6Q97_29825 [Desulfurellales bacterium]